MEYNSLKIKAKITKILAFSPKDKYTVSIREIILI